MAATGDAIKAQFQDLADKAKDDSNHDVRLQALRELSDRPGWKTTEFYVSLVCVTIGTTLQAVPGREMIGGLLIAAGTLAYNLSRGIAKKAAAVVLLALILGGCSAKGCVRADSLSPTFGAIRARHDAYVIADKSYDDPQSPRFGQRASDLRETKLMAETLSEASEGAPATK